MSKLETFGTDYLFQYIFYFIKHKNKQFIYQNYVCNCLKVIAENTARFAGGHTMAKTFNEILSYKPPENKSVNQIIADITANAGLIAK